MHNMQFWHFAIFYYLLINLLAFLFYGIDKRKAEGGKWRIPEHTLIGFAQFGGGVGALLGMIVFHHKTRKNAFRILVPLFLILHIVGICYFTYSNNHVVFNNYTYESSVNCRIVQLSDVHNMYPYWDKDGLADKVREQDPDYIVITGDLIDSRHTDMDYAVYLAGELAKITDTYYVTGNHERRFSDEELDPFFNSREAAGVHVLINESVYLKDKDGKDFCLVGLDDCNLASPRADELIETARANTPEAPIVVLAHRPDYIVNYANVHADLVLSGHYHGGQFIFGSINDGQGILAPKLTFFPEYTHGLKKVKRTTLITSRGIGNSVFPVRINNQPEIVVVDMVSR